MNDHDAVLRFDTTLDDMLTGECDSDPLAEVAIALQKLDLRQRGVPTDDFRTQLRRSLFTSSNGVHHLSVQDDPVRLIPVRPPVPQTVRTTASRRLLAIAAALLLLLVGGGAIVLNGIDWRDATEPSAIPAASFASPESPGDTAAVATRSQQTMTAPLIVANDTVYLFRSFDGFTGLVAERTEDSKRRWMVNGTANGKLAVDGRAVYVAFALSDSEAERVDAYSAKDGNTLWNWQTGGKITGLTVADGVVYAVATDGSLTALDGESGAVRWQAAVGNNAGSNTTVWGYETVAVSGSTVAALTSSGTFAILDRTDGSIRWSRDGYDPAATGFAIAGDIVFIIDRREFRTRADVTGLPEDAIVLNKPSAGVVVANAPGTVLPDGSRALAPVEGWASTGLDLVSGEMLWSGGFPAVSTPPVAIGNVIALGAEIRDPGGDRSGLVGIDARTGATTFLPGQPVTQLGTWQPQADTTAFFVSISPHGLLTVTAPHHLGGSVDTVDQSDIYDGAVVDLSRYPNGAQSGFGQPTGDESGIWLITADGGPASVHPIRLDQTIQHEMATGVAQVHPGGVVWALAPPDDVLLPPSSELVANDSGVLYQTFGGTRGTSVVRAVDLQRGQVLWERSIDRWVFELTVHDDLVLIAGVFDSGAGQSDTLIALDGHTGEAVWSVALAQWPVGLLVVDDMVIVLGRGNMLEAYDLASQALLWRTDLGDAPGAARIPVPDLTIVDKGRLATIDDTIGAITATGQLVSVDMATGEPRWVSERVNPGRTQVAAMDGRFVVVAYGIETHSRAPSTPAAATPTAHPTDGANTCERSFAVDPDDVLPSGTVTEGFDPVTGAQIWSLTAVDGDVVWTLNKSQLVGKVPREDTPVATDGPKTVYCLIDITTGVVTQTGDTLPEPAAMFRMASPEHPESDGVYAVLADGATLSITVQPDVAAAIPVFDRNIQDYGGAFNAHVADGVILITTVDGTLLALRDST